MNLAVETWDLSKTIRDNEILKNINIKIPKGSVYTLLGPNGAGKTTILKILMGLKRPSSGSGKCLGLDILTKSLQIREKTGYLSEEPRFYGYMTAKQLLDFCRGFYPQWDNRLVKHCLEVFELPAGQKVYEFSQGMKNQLALLLALAPRPELLILDEPTTGFDPIKRKLFFNVILEEIVAEGKTVLISSHQLNEVERIADQVGLLRRGKLLRECSLDELKTQEKEIRVVFQKEPPADFFDLPGVKEVKQEGKALRVVVVSNLEEIWQACANFPHYTLEIVGSNLEDIFLRYMEGEDKND